MINTQQNISAITIKGFKSFQTETRFEIKPITLLFGENSAGKSSFLQALLYVDEVLNTGNIYPEKSKNQDVIKLGTLDSIRNKNSEEICFTLEYNCESSATEDNIRTIRTRIEINANNEKSVQIYINNDDVPLLKQTKESAKYQIEPNLLNNYCDLTKLKDIKALKKDILLRFFAGRTNYESFDLCGDRDCVEAQTVYGSKNEEFYDLLIFCIDNVIDDNNSIIETLPEINLHFDNNVYDYVSFITIKPPSDLLGSIIKKWKKVQSPDLSDFLEAHKEIIQSSVQRAFNFEVELRINSLLSNSLKNNILSNLNSFIGPLRDIPERGDNNCLSAFDGIRNDTQKVWNENLLFTNNAVEAFNDPYPISNHDVEDIFKEKQQKYIDFINRAFKKLGFEYKLYTKPNEGIIDNTAMERYTYKYDNNADFVFIKKLVDSGHENGHLLDVGAGVSQVIPVLLAILSGSSAIQQPELHLHPKQQLALADLIADQVTRRNSSVYLETHSEHILLRLLRRIRETSDGTLAEGDPKLTKDDVAVHYLQATENGTKLTTLAVTDDGDFEENWPDGFFDERDEELF